MRVLVVLAMVLSLSGCGMGYGLRPASDFFHPPSYLADFPLGTVTETELLAKVGPPDRTLDMGGKFGFVYDHNKANRYVGNIRRQFTYIMVNGVVDDVLYTDDSVCNGSTARKVQAGVRNAGC
jgi:hypothetical protein